MEILLRNSLFFNSNTSQTTSSITPYNSRDAFFHRNSSLDITETTILFTSYARPRVSNSNSRFTTPSIDHVRQLLMRVQHKAHCNFITLSLFKHRHFTQRLPVSTTSQSSIMLNIATL